MVRKIFLNPFFNEYGSKDFFFLTYTLNRGTLQIQNFDCLLNHGPKDKVQSETKTIRQLNLVVYSEQLNLVVYSE